MANCVTCGEKLHSERALKYDYCTRPECREQNAQGFRVIAVGVNKAADQYVVLNERTKREMAGGRYKKQPDTPGSVPRRRRTERVRTPGRTRDLVPRSSASASEPRWSEAQKNLTLIYRAMGLRVPDIAKKLGVSQYLVTQILLRATDEDTGRPAARRRRPGN